VSRASGKLVCGIPVEVMSSGVVELAGATDMYHSARRELREAWFTGSKSPELLLLIVRMVREAWAFW
jgi:hypothetical protein